MYWQVFQDISPNNTYSDVAESKQVTTEARRFKVSGKPNTIYGLAVRIDPSKAPNVTENVKQTTVVFVDVAPSDAEGFVTFNVPIAQSFTFVESTTKIEYLNQGVIVRLSGDLSNSKGYIVIPPEQIKLE